MSVGEAAAEMQLDVRAERLSREALENLRLKRLKETVEHAYANSGFWHDRLRSAGVLPEDIQSVEDYTSRVPPVDKADLLVDQNESEPYGRRLAVPVGDIRTTYLTSGSSGQQQEVHSLTAADVDAITAMWSTSLRWGGVQSGMVAYLMVPVGLTAGPASLFNTYNKYGLQTFAVSALDGEARLQMMRRFKPHFFSCSPIYLRRLTRIAEQLDLDPRREFPDLTAIKLGTHGYSLDWAREMAETWGATLIDNYVSTQAGVGSTCEPGVGSDTTRRALIHMPDHRALYEVVDPETGQQVEYGEEGEAVVTPFDRVAMPLLRFRTGDRVRRLPSTYCTCGRPHDGVESGTITRFDNMIKIRGMNLWTQSIDDVVLTHPAVADYNGEVRVDEIGREVVELRVLFAAHAGLSDAAGALVLNELGNRIKDQTNVKCVLTAGTTDTVRQINYKERRWLDSRSQAL